VIELGCGPLGGLVPILRSCGYQAVGIDPDAPDDTAYRRIEFERAETFRDLDAAIASRSLHHVGEPAEVMNRVASSLANDGTFVVIEWAWEQFDEATAAWCFQRLDLHAEAGWLHRRRDEWAASAQPWPAYLSGWARKERLHEAWALLDLLDEHFHRVHLARGPCFFPDLAETTAEDEQDAISAGRIQATRVDYVGTPLQRPVAARRG
jgi:SAM-dependent methyltransferase